MNEPLAIAAAVLAWFGAVVMVLSDARRGRAVGIVLLGAGLAFERAVAGHLPMAVVIFAGALLAAVAGLRRSRARGWGILAAGSTPRVVLCIVAGALALYFGRVVIQEPADWQARAAVLAVGVLGGARLLSSSDPRATLTAASAAALAVALAAALVTPASGMAVMVAGALVAGVLSGLPTAAGADA